MASRDQLNKLRGGKFDYQNPYVQPPVEKKEGFVKKNTYESPVQKTEMKEKGIIEQNGYLLGRITILQEEINQLRLDVVSLLQIMNEDLPNMSLNAVRQYYSEFRAGGGHILNRIIDKKEAILNNDTSIKE